MSYTASAAPTTSLASSHIAIPMGAFVGIVAGKDGQPGYHLFLLSATITSATWEDAATFAGDLGGAMPTREEMPLLAKADNLTAYGPCWTADRMSGDRAMAYSFYTGREGYSHTSREFTGLAVRRDPIAPQDDDDSEPPAAAQPSLVDAIALMDADLWPVDSELLAEIHELFLQKWGMHAGQADARMSRFNYQAARATLEGGAA